MPPINRVQELVAEATRRGEMSLVEERLRQMDRAALRKDELELWYEYWGRAAEHRGEIDEAIARYEEGLAAFPRHPILPHLLRAMRERNRVDLLLERLQREKGGYVAAAVDAALARMERSRLRPEEQIAWHQAYAAAAMRLGARPEALARYRAGVESFPDADVLQFGLGLELDFAGDVDGAFAAFARVEPGRVPSEYALVIAQVAFLWRRPSEGLRVLWPLLAPVLGMPDLDEHLLFTRRLPAVPRLVRFAIALASQAGGQALDRLRAHVAPRAAALGRAGHAGLLVEIEALRANDLGPLIELLDREAASQPPGAPAGMRSLAARLAAGDLEAGLALEAALAAAPSPGPLGTVLAASVRHRAGDRSAERALLGRLRPEDLFALQASTVVEYCLTWYWDTVRGCHVASRPGRRR
jgi:tetratricopeptide (TPR) repeat protein